jgi:hypothetical protein
VERVAKAVLPISQAVLAWQVPRLPALDDPASKIWDRTLVVYIELAGQTTAPPPRPKPFVPTVRVAALHDRSTLAVRIEWSDPHPPDDKTIAVDAFRDACAVLLGPETDDAAVRFMGTPDVPVTLLHWKADWQRDLERGYQGLETQFPNATFDYYPPLTPAAESVEVPDDYEAHDATQWLPGYHVGNPISQMTKTSAVEKLVARGFGSATTQPTQNAEGHGVWRDDRWRVVIKRPLEGVDDEEITLVPGSMYSMAVAVWSGWSGDAGGHKSPSKALLSLEMTDW